jgi:hypothetical protein
VTSAFPTFPEPIWRAAEAAVESSAARDAVSRARAVGEIVDALDALPELAEPAARRSVLGEVRRRLCERLEQTSLGEPEGPARAATALEILVSLSDTPPRLEHDYPGLDARRRALDDVLGLDRPLRRRLLHRLLLEASGDMFIEGRAPHLHRGLFDLVLGAERVVSDRARALTRALLARKMSNLDHFLWFHLLARDREGARALFAKNDEAEVGAALRGLLADDAAYARMLADEDQRHGGRTRLTLGARDHAGLDQLRRLVRNAKPARWVDLAGGLNTFHRERAPGMDGRPTIAVELVRPDPDCLDNLVPVHASWAVHEDPRAGGAFMSARLLTDEELAGFRARVLHDPVDARTANLLQREALRAAVPPADAPTLYTLAAYLVSIRPQDEDLRRLAREGRVPGPRLGAMRMIENVLALLRPGDLLALAGRSVTPYLRGVCWLNAEVEGKGGLRVCGAGYRLGYPGFRVRWELG